MGMYLFASVMIVLNLAALRYRNEQGATFSAEVTVGRSAANAAHGISGRAAFGASPLNSADAKAQSANRPAAETLLSFAKFRTWKSCSSL